MGLDIVVYTNVKFVDQNPYNEYTYIYKDEDGNITEYDDDHIFEVTLCDEYPKQSEGLTQFMVDDCDCLLSFNAGSYGGYNTWRNDLAELAGYYESGLNFDEAAWEKDEGPFNELIKFTDCDGIINSKVSNKLYQDFLEFDVIAKYRDESFYKLYNYFKEAFLLASVNNGVVIFK